MENAPNLLENERMIKRMHASSTQALEELEMLRRNLFRESFQKLNKAETEAQQRQIIMDAASRGQNLLIYSETEFWMYWDAAYALYWLPTPQQQVQTAQPFEGYRDDPAPPNKRRIYP